MSTAATSWRDRFVKRFIFFFVALAAGCLGCSANSARCWYPPDQKPGTYAEWKTMLDSRRERGEWPPQRAQNEACHRRDDSAELLREPRDVAEQQRIVSADSEICKKYVDGKDVKPNYALAFQWCAQAANHGDAAAQQRIVSVGSELCKKYIDGKDVKPDYALAFKWCAEAAKHGDAAAQDCYTRIPRNFSGGAKEDYSEVMKWYRKAADQGSASAQHNIGVMYLRGEGVTKDYTEAMKWYRKAADQGYAGAEYGIGVMYEVGQGVGQDYTEALKWYRKAADQGHDNAQFKVGWSYAYGKGGVERDCAQARLWYEKAAAQAPVGVRTSAMVGLDGLDCGPRFRFRP